VHASHETLTLAHPAREVRVLKRHGVSEREMTDVAFRNLPSWQDSVQDQVMFNSFLVALSKQVIISL
jgi:hypothetical protein